MSTYEIPLGPGCGRHPSRTSAPDALSRAAVAPRDTLAHAVAFWADRDPLQPALYCLGPGDGATELSRGELLGRARALASGLRRLGVAAGEAVILAMDASVDLVASFLACTLIGATPSISDLSFSKHGAPAWIEKLRARIRVLGARAVITGQADLPLVQSLGEGGPGAPIVTTPGELEQGEVEDFEIHAAPDEIAFVQFTSGTASAGRAIRLSNRAVMANLRAMAAQRPWFTSDLLVSWLPLYHDMGLVANLLMALGMGIPIALMSPLHFLFQPSRWLWAVHHFRGTIIWAPNFAYEVCARRIGGAELVGLDLSSLRDVYNAAEFIHAASLRRFTDRYAGHGFHPDAWIPSYGMAELVVGASIRLQGAPIAIDRISRRELVTRRRAVPVLAGGEDSMEIMGCGRMLPGYSVRIVGEDGADLPERSEGKILLSGPSLFAGYHGEPEATAEVLRDGWLSTGDLGYVADGELYICGRSKDLIIKGGENYHPYAFESAVAEVPGVRPGGVAAIGVANAERGTEDLDIVFETEEEDVGRLRVMCSQIDRELQRRFGIRPDRLVPVAPRSIPKTTSGKIRRSALAGSLDQLDKLRSAPVHAATAPLRTASP